jgi:hypothetical protein
MHIRWDWLSRDLDKEFGPARKKVALLSIALAFPLVFVSIAAGLARHDPHDRQLLFLMRAGQAGFWLGMAGWNLCSRRRAAQWIGGIMLICAVGFAVGAILTIL